MQEIMINDINICIWRHNFALTTQSWRAGSTGYVETYPNTANEKIKTVITSAKEDETEENKTVGSFSTTLFNIKDLNYDDCTVTKVIKLLQSLINSPNAHGQNKALTKHIIEVLIKLGMKF